MAATGSFAELADALGRAFVDAFNRRDADGLAAICHPAVEYHPTALVGSHRVYTGHDGLRQWLADLAEAGAVYTGNVQEVRPLDAERFLMLTDILVGDEVISPSAMVATVSGGKILEARSYLSDEDVLAQIGVVPE